MKTIFGLFVFCIVISACKDVTGGQDDKLFEDVMGLHDEIMPVSTKLHGLQSSLKTLLATPDSIPANMTKDDVIAASMHAEEAYNAMMDWMRDFKVPENMNPTEKSAYLKAEKLKLTNLKEETLRAFNEAEAIVNSKK